MGKRYHAECMERPPGRAVSFFCMCKAIKGKFSGAGGESMTMNLLCAAKYPDPLNPLFARKTKGGAGWRISGN